MFDLAHNIATALRLNDFHFGNSCRPDQLPGLEDVLQMLADRRHLNPKEVGHL